MKIGWAALTAAVLLAGPAAAEPVEIGQIAQGVVYYNRPGATLAQHDAELAACIHDTLSPGNGTASMGQGVLGDLFFHMIWDGPIAGLQAAKVENCMLTRGWRAVRMPPAEGAAAAALIGDDLRRRMEPLVGAASPPGEIVRVFGGEAAHPTAYKTASRPAHPDESQLSLRLNADATAGVPLIHPDFERPPKLDPKWPGKSLKPTELASAPPGSALIVARVMGISNRWGTGVGLARIGAAPEARPSEADHAPDLVYAGTGFLFAKKEGNWFVLAVPPGRWRIANSGFVNYCLGSPSFEVKPGDVVYAGTFHLDGDDLGPDLALEPAKAYLGGPAGDSLRAAVYRNGSRGSCHSFGLVYALEIPGAPFEPGYAWGSAALKAP